MENTRVRNFIKGTLREYRFHLFFNMMGVFATDLDFMIQDRNGKICCLLEVKDHRGGALSDRHAAIYLQVAEALDVPFYYVRYTHDFESFWLYRYEKNVTGVTRRQIRDEAIDKDCLRDFLGRLADGESPADVECGILSLEDLY